jgi:tRNA modification GTPase
MPLCDARPRFMQVGQLLDHASDVLDEVLVVRFEMPRSYTRENLVEIQTHGGTLAAEVCLERLLNEGARLAEPGEFTQRAFLNGRLDLSQSEAVLGIIRSKSVEALRAATRTLSGELSEAVLDLRRGLLDTQARLEVGLDFPDEADPFVDPGTLEGELCARQTELDDLLDRCQSGFLLREGVRVALLGAPNVGKSSLLNALVRQARAIVTAIPGTTRDVIEESVTWKGIPIRLVDTAGIRASEDEVERLGIQRAEAEFERADICLWILDGSKPPEEQKPSLEYIDRLDGTEHILVLNKTDLPRQLTEEHLDRLVPGRFVLPVSAKHGDGLDRLEEVILKLTKGSASLNAGLNASARQLDELRHASFDLQRARDSIVCGLGDDVTASCLSEARMALERLLGLSWDDALLNHIFSRFCVGK